MQQPKNTIPTPPAPRRGGGAGPRSDRDAAHRPPSTMDSVLESIGKAVTEPIRDASGEEPVVHGTGAHTGRPGG